MRIIKQKTRIMFLEYTPEEKVIIENLVGTLTTTFLYEDSDKRMICIPTGLERAVRRLFPQVPFIDDSGSTWRSQPINTYRHKAVPRDQLQKDFIDFCMNNFDVNRKTAGVISTGTGKGSPLSTPIPTPNGVKPLGDLRVGDIIFGSTGDHTKVTGIYDKETQDIYKVTFSDGRSALCDYDHLWAVKGPDEFTYVARPLSKIMEDYLIDGDGCSRKYKYRIPRLTNPVRYRHQDVPVDPYLVGALLNYDITDTSKIDVHKEIHLELIADRCFDGDRSCTFDKKTCTLNISKKLDEFEDLKGYIISGIIPNIYKYNSISIRKAVIQGMMDSDNGSIRFDNDEWYVSYRTKNHMTAEGLLEIVRSLGINGSIVTLGEVYAVLLTVPNQYKEDLFTHPEKLNIAKNAKLMPDDGTITDYLYITNITKQSFEPSRCITVSAHNHLYLTEQFIVTHNTFMALYCAIEAKLKTIIIVPTSAIRNQWVDTLINMFNVPPEHIAVINNPKKLIRVKAAFTVVIHNSLMALDKIYDMESIMRDNQFGLKIIDETHLWFQNIIRIDGCCNIPNNLYLTGTFGRSSVEENKLFLDMFGDVSIFREKMKEPTLLDPRPGNIYGMKPHIHVIMIWSKGNLKPNQIAKVSRSWRYLARAKRYIMAGVSIPNYDKLVIPHDYSIITPYMRMLFKVIKRAFIEVDYGNTLILLPSINSVNRIHFLMEKLYPNLRIGTIHSKNKAAVNENNKKVCDCIISTVQSVGTGFDYKNLSRLILASPFKSVITTDQVLGRLRRREDGKDCYMWDIVDADVEQFVKFAHSRVTVLRRKSKSFKRVDV